MVEIGWLIKGKDIGLVKRRLEIGQGDWVGKTVPKKTSGYRSKGLLP